MDRTDSDISVITFGVDEAARRSGVSPRFIREEIGKGLLPVARLGTRVLIRRTDLENYLNERIGPYIPASVGKGSSKFSNPAIASNGSR